MKDWVKMPSRWILNKETPPLSCFKWKGDNKAAHISAIMLYITINHYANSEHTRELTEIGCAKLSYTELMNITDVSRAKIAEGLNILISMKLIEKIGINKTNIYKISNYKPDGGWAKLPAKSLYDKSMNHIIAFKQFKLRSKNELNALKLFLLLIALRNDDTNYANASYNTINLYTGISKNDIRSAISLLININFINVDKSNSDLKPDQTINLYRITGIDRYKHGGTISQEKLEDILLT